MDRILTLLLAFLLALAPIAPAEAGSGHAHAMIGVGENSHWHDTDASAEAPLSECSLAGSHCVLAVVPPVRNFFEAGYSSGICSVALAQVLAGGIVLTAEPPPPRA